MKGHFSQICKVVKSEDFSHSRPHPYAIGVENKAYQLGRRGWPKTGVIQIQV